MTDEEKQAAWYSVNEITAFRNDARETSSRIRKRNSSQGSVHKPQHELIDDIEDSRGLEYRLSSKRQQNKMLAMRMFMEYQRRLRLRAKST
eukprot:2396815-Ditylum_brightwellii.AAC.1